MGDFGLYAALSGTDNWAQKRQDKASNLMMLERMEQRSQQQVNSQMQAEQGIQEQLDLMSTFDVLPEDQKAIEEVENKARMNIIKGITKFNGDLKKYVSSGGLTDLGEYKRSVLTSSEMKNAVTNKAQYAQYIDAKQKDMFVGKAQVKVPVFDSKGSPKMKDGEIVREIKNLTMDEQMALRKRGLLDNLQVGMIEKKARINPDYFKKNYKDATKPWSADNIVTEQNIMNTLKTQGFSDEQANKLANEYGDGLTAENALKWKAMDQLELEKQQAAIQYRLSKSNGSSTGSSKTRITNTLKTTFDKLKENPGSMYPTSGINKVDGAAGAARPIPNKMSKYWTQWIKQNDPLVYDVHYGKFKDAGEENEGKYNLHNAIVNLQEYVTEKNPDNNNQAESFIKAKVFYPDGTIPYDEDSEYRKNSFKPAIRNTWDSKKKEWNDTEGVEGHVFIPIERLVMDKNIGTEVAKYQNQGTNINNNDPGATFQGDIQNNDRKRKDMVDRVMSQTNPKTQTLYTIEEAEQIVLMKLAQQ